MSTLGRGVAQRRECLRPGGDVEAWGSGIDVGTRQRLPGERGAHARDGLQQGPPGRHARTGLRRYVSRCGDARGRQRQPGGRLVRRARHDGAASAIAGDPTQRVADKPLLVDQDDVRLPADDLHDESVLGHGAIGVRTGAHLQHEHALDGELRRAHQSTAAHPLAQQEQQRTCRGLPGVQAVANEVHAGIHRTGLDQQVVRGAVGVDLQANLVGLGRHDALNASADGAVLDLAAHRRQGEDVEFIGAGR